LRFAPKFSTAASVSTRLPVLGVLKVNVQSEIRD
jgi:hypothetical protein